MKKKLALLVSLLSIWGCLNADESVSHYTNITQNALEVSPNGNVKIDSIILEQYNQNSQNIEAMLVFNEDIHINRHTLSYMYVSGNSDDEPGEYFLNNKK